VHKHGAFLQTNQNSPTLPPSKLRGNLPEAVKTFGNHSEHHKAKAIVALQAAQSTHSRSFKESSDLDRAARLLAKRELRKEQAQKERSYFNKLLSQLRKESVKKQRGLHLHAKKVNLCNGNQYQWMVETRQACKDN
jgi:hypothetical protein